MNNTKKLIKNLLDTYKTKASANRAGVLLNVNCEGNKKLKNTDDSMFMIWNIPAIKTCPFATAACKRACYAKRAERYANTRKSRYENFVVSQRADFVENMIFTILKLTEKTPDRKIVFRIHESGDFYNKIYADKWVKIAEYFQKTKARNIVFMAYTKSVIYFDGVKIPTNIIIRFSLWDDTSADQIEIAKRNNLPVYTAVCKDFDFKANKVYKCDCRDCMNCGACWNKRKKEIACIIH